MIQSRGHTLCTYFYTSHAHTKVPGAAKLFNLPQVRIFTGAGTLIVRTTLTLRLYSCHTHISPLRIHFRVRSDNNCPASRIPPTNHNTRNTYVLHLQTRHIHPTVCGELVTNFPAAFIVPPANHNTQHPLLHLYELTHIIQVYSFESE